MKHQTITSKTNAKVTRKLNQCWKKVEWSSRYRIAASGVLCDTVTQKIESEVLEGLLLSLNVKSQEKSMRVQNRILRRIVEKRQAQANYKKYGKTNDLTFAYNSMLCANQCMEAIRKRRFAA